MINIRNLSPIFIVMTNTDTGKIVKDRLLPAIGNLKFQNQDITFFEVEERPTIDNTLLKRAEYFNFLKDRGLL